MCSWCEKETELVPMECDVFVPVICKDCGGKVKNMNLEELRQIFREWYKSKRGE